MRITDLAELPSAKEIAVIINAGTKHVATLALLSALRYAGMPVVMIDCESRDGSYEWFNGLLRGNEFYLTRAKLRPHGETLDHVFSRIPVETVLLIDSDAELINSEMISRMRSMLDASSRAYGSGFLHRAHWLENHYWTDLPLAPGIGYYMARPWIPFTLLRVEPVRAALARGRTFMHRLVLNELPSVPSLSGLLWSRFRFSFFRQHRLPWLDAVRGNYNGERPAYVSYDTGADIHEFLTGKEHLVFESVPADSVPWSVTHFSGITRGSLHDGATADAHKLTDAYPIIVQRLRDLYGIDVDVSNL